jgi:mRNA-degrading endonuclease RelE of RelBE toxin-antitoxin system
MSFTFQIQLHPTVVHFLDRLSTKERKKCIEALKLLGKDPFKSRTRCDIKKLKGKRSLYRLRVGKNRFEYFVKEDCIWVVSGFQRGRGYK